MAVVTTSLAAACMMDDTQVTVASAMGFAVGQYLYVDTEVMVQRAVASGLVVPVRRGVDGSAQTAHAHGATVTTKTPIDQTTTAQASVRVSDTGDVQLPSTGQVEWPEVVIATEYSAAGEVSKIVLREQASDDLDWLCFGGTTAGHPAFYRPGSTLALRKADDSSYTDLAVADLDALATAGSGGQIWADGDIRSAVGFYAQGTDPATSGFLLWNRVWMQSEAAGNLLLKNAVAAGFGLLQFGGTTNAYPALKRSSTTLQVRLADDSGDAGLKAKTLTLSALPTSDPGVPGALWNSAGTVKISP